MFQEVALALIIIAGMLLLVCIIGAVAIFRDWHKWRVTTEIRAITAEKENALRKVERLTWEIDTLKTELGKCQNMLMRR